MATTKKKKAFPVPAEVSDVDPVAYRSSEDMIAIANQANDWNYKNLSPAVQKWIRDEGIKHGWAAVYLPLAYPSKTLRAGAVFVKKKL